MADEYDDEDFEDYEDGEQPSDSPRIRLRLLFVPRNRSTPAARPSLCLLCRIRRGGGGGREFSASAAPAACSTADGREPD
mgnify:CR=1 FL=1